MIGCLPAKVRALLDNEDVDVAVADYLVGVSEEVGAGTMDFDDFVDTVLLILRDHAIASKGKQSLIEKLLEDQDTAAHVKPVDSIDADNEAQAGFAPEKLSDLMRRTHVSDHEKAASDDDRAQQHASPSVSAEDISTLRAVTGIEASYEFLQHLLRQHRSLEEAVEWVLDQSDKSSLESKWRLHVRGSLLADREREQSKIEQEAIKKSIVASFAFAPETVDRSKPGKPDKAIPWGEAKKPNVKGSAGMVRYRESMKVASKGEKHIYEQVTPDWDGGSRGKVYSKGKRGKGFH